MKNKIIIVCVTFLATCFVLMSASGINETDIDTLDVSEYSESVIPAKVVKVLAIGGSFFEDAIEQNLHELAEA